MANQALIAFVSLIIGKAFSCPNGYTYCADEWERCNFTGTVAYGLGDTYIFKESTDEYIECTNDVFTDPLHGVFKECCSKNPMISGHFIVDGSPFNMFSPNGDDTDCVSKPDECTPDPLTHGQHPINLESPKMAIAVQCCTSDGGQAYRDRVGCVSGVNYTEAVRVCSEEGLRLCTKQELLTSAFAGKRESCDYCGDKCASCPISCDFNHHHIWTSTECSTERTVVDLVDDTEECAPQSLSDADVSVGVQCCSLDGSHVSYPECVVDSDYESAARMCSELALRLCSKEEALSNTMSESDCDIERVWTSSKCASEHTTTAAPTLDPTPDPTKSECSSWSTGVVHKGTVIDTLDFSQSPDGKLWTQLQCAERCALSDECEFWRWGRSYLAATQPESVVCYLLKERGDSVYAGGSGWREGAKDLNCITEPTESPTIAPTVGGWSFSWSDEFDGPEIDETVWGRYQRSSWSPECKDRAEYTRIEDGMLVLEAVQEGASYCAGQRWTQNRKSWLYGRFSIRAKWDLRDGYGFCWWWLGDQIDWPTSGEVDMPEGFGDTTRINWVVHNKNDEGNDEYHGDSFKMDVATFPSEFHTYSWEWTATDMKFYMDGDLMFTYDLRVADGTGQCGQNPYRRPGYMLLGSGLGSGNLGSGSIKPPYLSYVDWLRVWKWDPTATSALISVTNGAGSGMFEVGTMAQIVAKPAESGYEFMGWTVVSEEDVQISDDSLSFATITVPSGGATITANYQLISDSAKSVPLGVAPEMEMEELGEGSWTVKVTIKDIVIVILLAVNLLVTISVICVCSKRPSKYEPVAVEMCTDSEM